MQLEYKFVSSKQKSIEYFIHFKLFLSNFINPHMHKIFLQVYCMKWISGDPRKEMLNYLGKMTFQSNKSD